MSKNTAKIQALTVTLLALLLEEMQASAGKTEAAPAPATPEPTPTPEPAKTAKASKAEKAPEPAKAEEPAAEEVTAESLRALAVEALKKGKKDELKKILAKHGAEAISKLEDKHYASVHGLLSKLVA